MPVDVRPIGADRVHSAYMLLSRLLEELPKKNDLRLTGETELDFFGGEWADCELKGTGILICVDPLSCTACFTFSICLSICLIFPTTGYRIQRVSEISALESWISTLGSVSVWLIDIASRRDLSSRILDLGPRLHFFPTNLFVNLPACLLICRVACMKSEKLQE